MSPLFRDLVSSLFRRVANGNCLYLYPANAGFFPIVLSSDIPMTRTMSNLLAITVSAATLVAGTIAFMPRKAEAKVYCTHLNIGRICAHPTGTRDEYYVEVVGAVSRNIFRVQCNGRRMVNWTGQTTYGPESTQSEKHGFAEAFCPIKPRF